MIKLNSEKLIFYVEIFRSPNRVSDSVSDADSHDIYIFVGIPGNPILDFLENLPMRRLYPYAWAVNHLIKTHKVALSTNHNGAPVWSLLVC